MAGVHAGELWLVYNAILWLVYTMPCCGWCTLSRVAGDKECEWPVTEDTPSKKGIIVKPNLVQKLKKNETDCDLRLR